MITHYAQIIFNSLWIFVGANLILWILAMIDKQQLRCPFAKGYRHYLLLIVLALGGIVAIYDFTPASTSDLRKIDQYLLQAQQSYNYDLAYTIQDIKEKPHIRVADRKYIEKLIEKGI